jgi:monothiol glutaredoxin
MSRPMLDQDAYHPRAQSSVESFHKAITDEVAAAVARDKIVVVGMAQNPHVKRARKALDGREFTYLEYGSYLAKWRERLAIKMWAGWPTFPMVFVGGKLLGGASELVAALAAGELDKLLTEGSHG